MFKPSHCQIERFFIIAWLLAAWFGFTAFLDSPSNLNQKGNKLFSEKRYQSAIEAYRKAQVKKPNQPEILYNLGTTLYKTDQFSDAAGELQKSVQENRGDRSLLAKSWYNFGNALYRLGRFEDAIEAYKKTLDLDPQDKEAKHNLELLLKKKGLFEKKQQERNKNTQKKSEQKNQEQQSQGGGSGTSGKENKTPTSQKGGGEEKEQPKPEKEEKLKGTEEPEPKPGEEKNEEKNMKEEKKAKLDEKKSEDQVPQIPENAKPKAPLLQGQMSQENAHRILDALRDSEKDLQVLRKPKARETKERTGNDW